MAVASKSPEAPDNPESTPSIGYWIPQLWMSYIARRDIGGSLASCPNGMSITTLHRRTRYKAEIIRQALAYLSGRGLAEVKMRRWHLTDAGKTEYQQPNQGLGTL